MKKLSDDQILAVFDDTVYRTLDELHDAALRALASGGRIRPPTLDEVTAAVEAASLEAERRLNRLAHA